jgi:trehalose 6-phosphate phosphatase
MDAELPEMKILNSQKKLSDFFDCLKKSRSRALLLDYDGTLAPFRVERDKALPYPGVIEVLKQLMQNGGTRLVLISGRRLNDLIPLLGLERLPEIWGSHGAERLLPDGSYQKLSLPKDCARRLEAAANWMARMGWNGCLERKPFGLGLHWRGMKPGETEEIRARVLEQLPHLVAGTGLSLHEFDGGLELRSPGITKGKAVQTILAEMQGETIAAYLGDDLGDEDAFGALKGRNLGVLVRDELRETKADLWLRPPDELLDFLRRWQTKTTS